MKNKGQVQVIPSLPLEALKSPREIVSRGSSWMTLFIILMEATHDARPCGFSRSPPPWVHGSTSLPLVLINWHCYGYDKPIRSQASAWHRGSQRNGDVTGAQGHGGWVLPQREGSRAHGWLPFREPAHLIPSFCSETCLQAQGSQHFVRVAPFSCP